MNWTSELLQHLAQEPAVLVSVVASRGSVPRETGAWMAVFAQHTLNTVGGGHLEWDAMARARAMLACGTGGADGTGDARQTYTLGPSLGQCCGGVVELRFEYVSAKDGSALAQRLTQPTVAVALFGGGHVGGALVQVLGNLPMAVTWIDSRDEIFPDALPASVRCEHSDPVQAAVADLAPGSRVLIMSFSHAQDLDVVAACLARQRVHGDLPYVGLIGSKTKWASFQKRLAAQGFSPDELAHITCPIGIPGITDKRPEVIAVAVAAQLLQVVP